VPNDTGLGVLLAELHARKIDIVRILWSDLHGVARGKDVTTAELPRAVEHGVAFCQALMVTDLSAVPIESVDSSGSGWPDAIARPDLASVRYPDYVSGVAIMLADIDQSHSTGGARPGPLPFSPREILRREVAALDGHGLVPVMAPELEFYLCRPTPQGWRPYLDRDTGAYLVGVANDPEDILATLIRRCVALDLGVLAGNHEFSAGQFEINHMHSGAVDAADRAFLFKHAVKEIAAQRGLRATFMGMPFDGLSGSGTHVHVSLTGTDGRNAFAVDSPTVSLSALGQHFLAGLLAHGTALTAILNPTVNAFTRLAGAGDGLAPSHINWGLDNRTAFVRVPPEDGPSTRLELRVGDAAANPYLAFAAILAAGRDGIERSLPLADPLAPGAPRTGTRLPRSLADALAALEHDTELSQALGEQFVRVFAALKRQEIAHFERAVTDWEFNHYSWLL
jgi:glutamine synthetase